MPPGKEEDDADADVDAAAGAAAGAAQTTTVAARYFSFGVLFALCFCVPCMLDWQCSFWQVLINGARRSTTTPEITTFCYSLSW